MTKTIAELWSGNLDPIRYLGKNNPEVKHLEDLMQRNLDRLEENMNEKAKDIMERYNDCLSEYLTLNTEQAFCDGFCLGMKIAVEAMFGAEQIG